MIKVANVSEGDVLNIRKEPNANSDKTGYLQWNDTKKYTIVEEKNGWGRFKSGIGWINLKYTVKVYIPYTVKKGVSYEYKFQAKR